MQKIKKILNNKKNLVHCLIAVEQSNYIDNLTFTIDGGDIGLEIAAVPKVLKPCTIIYWLKNL